MYPCNHQYPYSNPYIRNTLRQSIMNQQNALQSSSTQNLGTYNEQQNLGTYSAQQNQIYSVQQNSTIVQSNQYSAQKSPFGAKDIKNFKTTRNLKSLTTIPSITDNPSIELINENYLEKIDNGNPVFRLIGIQSPGVTISLKDQTLTWDTSVSNIISIQFDINVEAFSRFVMNNNAYVFFYNFTSSGPETWQDLEPYILFKIFTLGYSCDEIKRLLQDTKLNYSLNKNVYTPGTYALSMFMGDFNLICGDDVCLTLGAGTPITMNVI
jgi:hypothetical protein